MVWMSAGSQVAAIPMAVGNSVVACFDQTPCKVWFHPPHAGMCSRSLRDER